MPTSPSPCGAQLDLATISTEQLANMVGYKLRGRPLTTEEFSEWLNRPKNSVEIDRLRGSGPRFFKIGRLVRYAERDVLEWFLSNARTSTSQSAHVPGGPCHE